MNKFLMTLTGAVMAATIIVMPSMAEKKDAPSEIAGATTVDAERVIEIIDEMDDLVLIDARKAKDFIAGHIDGSINIVSTDVNADTLGAALAAKDTPVLFYCNGVKCGRSSVASTAAVAAGYTNVFYYWKGMGEWKEQGLPVVTGKE